MIARSTNASGFWVGWSGETAGAGDGPDVALVAPAVPVVLGSLAASRTRSARTAADNRARPQHVKRSLAQMIVSDQCAPACGQGLGEERPLLGAHADVHRRRSTLADAGPTHQGPAEGLPLLRPAGRRFAEAPGGPVGSLAAVGAVGHVVGRVGDDQVGGVAAPGTRATTAASVASPR